MPRLVSVLPNGPEHHPTVRVFLAGGVPKVMLHLRRLGLLRTEVMTVSGRTVDDELDLWEGSDRRHRFREVLSELDGVDADDVICPPAKARERRMYGTATFPTGNLAPQGSVVKSGAIDTTLLDALGVYRHEGPVRVFVDEREAITAIKSGEIVAGDVLVLTGCGPLGTGMEETFQLTSALTRLPWGRRVALITDARFSGVSTGACVGHVGPEGLAGGPIGRLIDNDVVQLVIDCRELTGSIDLVGHNDVRFDPATARSVLAARPQRADMATHTSLPDDTRLWALLQELSGGTWGGCVYDVDAIERRLVNPSNSGRRDPSS